MQGGSGLPTLGKGSTIPQDLDQSFDVLMTNKTDVTRTIFESALHPFGFRFLELRFPDINRANVSPIETNFTTERVALQRLGVPFGRQLSKSELTKMAEESALFRQEKDRVFQDLNAIGMAPTKDQIDLLISAGRAVVADRFDEIKEQFSGLIAQEYREVCEDIFNIDNHYCWPQELTDRDLLRSPLRIVLSRLDTVKEQHIKRITANRDRAIARLRDTIRAGLNDELIEGYKIFADIPAFLGDYLCEVPRKDRDYFKLYNRHDVVNDLNDLIARCDEIKQLGPSLIKHDANLLPPESDSQNTNSDSTQSSGDGLGAPATKTFLRKFEEILNRHPSIEKSLPQYYAYLIGSAKLIYLQDPSGLTLLYQNRSQGPADININEQIGLFMTLRRSEYAMGLRHILIAIERNRAIHTKLRDDIGRLDLLNDQQESLFKQQQERFLAAEHWYRILFTRLYTASPRLVEINGLPHSNQDIIEQDISEQDITDWTNTHYPDGKGGTVVALPNGSQSLKQLAHRRCLLLEIIITSEMRDTKELQKCKTNENGLHLEAYHNDIESFSKTIRRYARQDIKKSGGLKLALRYAEEAYRDQKTYPRDIDFPYERHLYWGLTLLVASAEASCPERQQAVETARRLIQKGVELFHKEQQKGTHYSEAIKKSIHLYVTLPEYFECTSESFSQQTEVAKSN